MYARSARLALTGPEGPAKGIRYPPMGENRTEAPDGSYVGNSGWVITKIVAAALGVTPRTIRTYIREGELEGKAEQEGINKRLLVSIASLDELRIRRETGRKFRRQNRPSSAPENSTGEIAEVIRDLSSRLEQRAAEAADLRARLELTAEAESTLTERVEKLEAELEAERSKGFWRRLFGG
jgi:predicted transcriptional regulator